MSARKPAAAAGAVPRGEASGDIRIPGAFPAAPTASMVTAGGRTEEVRQQGAVQGGSPREPVARRAGAKPGLAQTQCLGVENRIPVAGSRLTAEKTPVQPAAG